MTDLSGIVGTIITATLMFGGMQLTLWSFTDAAIREPATPFVSPISNG